ncbi:MAG: S-adenosyl-l-methionine hydroxide adenosyltransferase family protein [Candidatus Hydrothermarchaeota archaeon]
MKTVAFLSDFGLEDPYVGVVKGVILRECPHANIIDISHGIRKFDIVHGALVLESSFRYFPQNTVFLVVVDPGVGPKRRAIVIKTENYWFIGPDNGILYPSASKDSIVRAFEIPIPRLETHTFHARDVFAPLVGKILKSERLDLKEISPESIEKLNLGKAIIYKKKIFGEILTIDHFGNLITNIRYEDLKKISEPEKDKYVVKIKESEIVCEYHLSYSEVKEGEYLLTTGSAGRIELAKNKGNASLEIGNDISKLYGSKIEIRRK